MTDTNDTIRDHKVIPFPGLGRRDDVASSTCANPGVLEEIARCRRLAALYGEIAVLLEVEARQ